jgi:hypothetical protein
MIRHFLWWESSMTFYEWHRLSLDDISCKSKPLAFQLPIKFPASQGHPLKNTTPRPGSGRQRGKSSITPVSSASDPPESTQTWPWPEH